MSNISPLDWNFDSVPDDELVACFYWEYAHESAFIRDLRQRCWECLKPLHVKLPGSSKSEERRICRDLETAQSIGYASEVFVHGIFPPPESESRQFSPRAGAGPVPLTGSFPNPWHTLSAAERASQAHIGTDYVRCITLEAASPRLRERKRAVCRHRVSAVIEKTTPRCAFCC